MGVGGRWGEGGLSPPYSLEVHREDLGIRPNRMGFVGLTHSSQEHPELMDPTTLLSVRSRIPLFFASGPQILLRPPPPEATRNTVYEYATKNAVFLGTRFSKNFWRPSEWPPEKKSARAIFFFPVGKVFLGPPEGF